MSSCHVMFCAAQYSVFLTNVMQYPRKQSGVLKSLHNQLALASVVCISSCLLRQDTWSSCLYLELVACYWEDRPCFSAVLSKLGFVCRDLQALWATPSCHRLLLAWPPAPPLRPPWSVSCCLTSRTRSLSLLARLPSKSLLASPPCVTPWTDLRYSSRHGCVLRCSKAQVDGDKTLVLCCILRFLRGCLG